MDRHLETREITNKSVQEWIGVDHTAHPFRLFRPFIILISLLLSIFILINSYFLLNVYGPQNKTTLSLSILCFLLSYLGYILALSTSDKIYLKLLKKRGERLIVQLFKQWLWMATTIGATNIIAFTIIYQNINPGVTHFFTLLKTAVLGTLFAQILIPGFIILAIFLQYLYRSRQEDGYKVFTLMISIIILYLVMGINFLKINVSFLPNEDITLQLWQLLNNLSVTITSIIAYLWLLRWVTDH